MTADESRDDLPGPDGAEEEPVIGPGGDAESAPPDGAAEAEPLSDADQELLDSATGDLVAEYRDRAARAEAELVNFRARVERDRQANRDAVIAEVLRSVIPAFDDLARAEAHGDVPEGSSMAMVVAKLRGGFEKFGLRQVGEVGERFDPNWHEAVASLPADVEAETVFEVIQPGYLIGERVVRPAKVAVQVPKSE